MKNEILNRLKKHFVFKVESIEQEGDHPNFFNVTGKDSDGKLQRGYLCLHCPDLELSLAERLSAKAKGQAIEEPVTIAKGYPEVELSEDGEVLNQEAFVGLRGYSNFSELFTAVDEPVLSKIKEHVDSWAEQNPPALHYRDVGAPVSPSGFTKVERIAIELGACGSSYLPAWDAGRIGIEREDALLGLYLYGASFTGKTTSAYRFAELFLAARSLYSIEGKERFYRSELPVVWEADAFGDTAKAKAKTTTLTAWLESLTEPEVLILDDLDKFQFSESVGVALWGLIKRRIECRRFTLFTSNETAKQMAKRFKANSEPFLNRLEQFYLPMKFTGKD